MSRSTKEAPERELAHQQVLLHTHTQQLQIIEQQIAMFGPALVPVHLLTQRDWFEAERTRALRQMQSLERKKIQPKEQSAPKAVARLLTSTLPTGLLHLMSSDTFPLVEIDVYNPTSADVTFVVTSWIEEQSYARTDRVLVPAGKKVTHHQLPVVKPLAFATIYDISKGVLQVRVSYLWQGQEALLLLQSFEVSFLARDVLLWGTIQGDRSINDLSTFIGAWVTPNERSIVELLRQAAEYTPSKQLWGYQGTGTPEQRAARARAQVSAIFEALKAHGGITYINSPLSMGPNNGSIRQRISLPRDSLTYRQANCIDGAVLYASLIERAAMNPAIMIIPGHAFVGWETWGGSGRYEFLETTMTGSHSFVDAWQQGQAQFAQAEPFIGRPLFDPGGFARLLVVLDLRRRGIVPVR